MRFLEIIVTRARLLLEYVHWSFTLSRAAFPAVVTLADPPSDGVRSPLALQ